MTRSPAASGLAISLGGMIKLYPFALAAPLLATKKVEGADGSRGWRGRHRGGPDPLLPGPDPVEAIRPFLHSPSPSNVKAPGSGTPAR
ncbi:MAG: hypothetical protein MZV64_59650 [Ignavibacteriales bacterium]|nr:hypothetical protein [Ignavibacteriales bacterium]